MTFLPIARSSLRDDIVASLRVAILNGTLAAGERVFETKIAEQMCVSRVPVREALTLLEQEGLIERLPNRGTFVTKLSNVLLYAARRDRGVCDGVGDGAPHGGGHCSPQRTA